MIFDKNSVGSKIYIFQFQYQIYSNSGRRATQYSGSSSGSNSGRSGMHDFPHQLVPSILCPPHGYQTMPSPAKHVVVAQVRRIVVVYEQSVYYWNN